MPFFLQHRLHEPTVAASYLPLLRRLDRFDHLNEAQRKRREAGADLDLEMLTEHHDAIHDMALQRAGEGRRIEEQEATEAFVCGMLRALRYRDTVLAGPPLVDLAGSKTLADFAPDIDPTHAEAVRTALRDGMGLEPAVFDRLESGLEAELKRVGHRSEIVAALDARFPLDDPREGPHALFTALFPDHPLAPGEVSLVRTGTSLFFCIPYDEHVLTAPARERTPAEQADLRAFLERIAQFEQPYLANFPVFGCFHAGQVEPALLDALCSETRLPRNKLIRKLTTMVAVLPTDKLDQYLVHDAWGHQWQALLYDFESRYQDASRYRRPPAYNGGYGPKHIDLLWAAKKYAETGSFEVFDGWIQAAFGHRLLTTLAGLFAEVLADAVEYKYLHQHPEKRTLMPSSSFFKELPAKLDLTLHDLPWYFEMAQKGFGRLAWSTDERGRLTDALRAEGHEDPEQIADALAGRVASWLDETYRGDLTFRADGEQVHVNVFARVALHFAQLHASLNALYERLERQPLPDGFAHFGDALVFTTASFYERDFLANFWTTDDFLEQWFEKLWARLRDALQETWPRR